MGVGAIGATAAAAIQWSGRAELVLCGTSAGGNVSVEAPWAETAIEVGPIIADSDQVDRADWVLLAVKAHQTPSTRHWLDRLVAPGTVVAVLQNGVEHRERVAPYAPSAEILPVVVWFGAQAVERGRVRVLTTPRLTVPASSAGHAFKQLLDGTLAVDVTHDFLTQSWRKLCTNAVSGLMAAARQPARIFRSDEIYSVALRLAEECVQVGRAEGARLPLDYAEEVAESFAALPPESGSSILADSLANRPLEWDARNGVIRRLGVRHGIPTPVSDTLVPLLAQRGDADDQPTSRLGRS